MLTTCSLICTILVPIADNNLLIYPGQNWITRFTSHRIQCGLPQSLECQAKFAKIFVNWIQAVSLIPTIKSFFFFAFYHFSTFFYFSTGVLSSACGYSDFLEIDREPFHGSSDPTFWEQTRDRNTRAILIYSAITTWRKNLLDKLGICQASTCTW